MKRAGRWLFNFVAAVSLLMCLATIVMWIRSYFRDETIIYASRIDTTGKVLRVWVAEHHNGAVRIRKDQIAAYAPQRFLSEGLQYSVGPYSARPREVGAYAPSALGFVLMKIPMSTNHASNDWTKPAPGVQSTWDRLLIVGFPHWSIVLASAFAPVCWLLSYNSARKAKRVGLCPVCGYDLRATPDRCPECGAIPEGAKGAAT